MLTMKPKKPTQDVTPTDKPNTEGHLYQAGWRVDQRDMHIFHGISKWAEENRYSRNVAITIAVEFFLKAQEQKALGDQPK